MSEYTIIAPRAASGGGAETGGYVLSPQSFEYHKNALSPRTPRCDAKPVTTNRNFMPGTLYLVATPIGNLEDITLRALRILKEVAAVAAEDTRQTRKLLARFEIGVPLVSYHEHSGPAATAALVRRMREQGDSIALVTDAGTPGISDPGVELVCAAIEAGVPVSPVPGASTPICALIASGLPSARFLFEGFLPRTRSSRVEKLKALASERRTLIFFEAPTRLAATLAEMSGLLGPDRPACVAREITKLHEEFRRDTLSGLAASYAAESVRGECCVVVHGSEGKESDPATEAQDSGAGWKELLKRLAKEAGIDRKALYQAVVQLKAQERNNAQRQAGCEEE